MYVVYMHEHRDSGKKYIGITKKKPEHRWNHGRGYPPGTYFRTAIDKHGWDSFNHVILHKDLTYEEACELEKKLIAEHKSNDREYGYNNSVGGELSALGVKLTEEQKKRLSESHKGKKFSEEHRRHLSERARNYHQCRKAVVCVETGIEYCSIIEASRQTGIVRTTIAKCCAGKPHFNTAGKLPDGTKLHWHYKDIG